MESIIFQQLILLVTSPELFVKTYHLSSIKDRTQLHAKRSSFNY